MLSSQTPCRFRTHRQATHLRYRSVGISRRSVGISRLKDFFTVHRLMLLSCVLATVSLAPGCNLFNPRSETATLPELSNNGMPQTARYQMVFESDGRRQRTETVELRQPTTVQEAIEQSDAVRAFGKMEVEIVRMNPQTGRAHKMPVTFDNRTEQVMDEQNYALYANDRVVITYIESSPVDGLLSAIGITE